MLIVTSLFSVMVLGAQPSFHRHISSKAARREHGPAGVVHAPSPTAPSWTSADVVTEKLRGAWASIAPRSHPPWVGRGLPCWSGGGEPAQGPTPAGMLSRAGEPTCGARLGMFVAVLGPRRASSVS